MSVNGLIHVVSERETVSFVSPGSYTYHRFRLLVTGGPNKGVTQDAERSEFLIGSAPGNDLVLSDPTVSRHHCALTATAEGVIIRDLGSKNGTVLGGFRVESAYLKSGATISLGSTTLRFEDLEEQVSEPLAHEERWGRVLGKSMAMRRIFALLPRMAASDATILLEGEAGTGKKMLAETIHAASARAGAPFIVVDCAAIAPAQLENELFGREGGRPGAFEAARGGTIVLEEIGDLPLDLQPRILRLLEERVGDVRVIAATSRDLRVEVNKGTFRADLFQCLNGARIRVPALRERREDIPVLATHFYRQLVEGQDHEPPADLLAWLARQELPGNVRELRGAVERVVLTKEPEPPRATTPAPTQHAEDVFDPTATFRAAKERAVKRWERGFVAELIRRSHGNLSRAARGARMDRNHLRELLKRHGVPIRESE